MEGRFGWPNIECQRNRQGRDHVPAELPGLSEKDVQVEIANGVLTPARREEVWKRTDNGGRYFSERYYGSFERQIPLDGVDGRQGRGKIPRRRLDDHAAEIRAGPLGRQAHPDQQPMTTMAAA